MQIQANREGAALVIRLIGELDHHSAKEATTELDRYIEQTDCNEVCFNLKGLTMMDSSGIGVLLGRYKKLTAKGMKASLSQPNRTIDRVLKLSGLYQIMRKVG